VTNTATDESFEELIEFLRDKRGFDFSGYKRSSLMRRTRKRMHDVGVESFPDYRDFLEVHQEEFAALFDTVLINVTSFFRDAAAWTYLDETVLPELVSLAESRPLRIWNPGCASGEETYTLAMLLAERLGADRLSGLVKIYATDIDEQAIEAARQGSYPPKALEGVPEDLRARYFEARDARYSADVSLRRAMIFGRHDLVNDAPISRLDLLVCRNTLMYLNRETQSRVLMRFNFALNDRGVLFLGRSEMLLTHTNLFAPLEQRHRIFRKVPQVTLRDRLIALTQAGEEGEPAGPAVGGTLRDAAFEASLTPQLVVDTAGTLALANAAAMKLFELDGIDVGRPFEDLTVSYRPVNLASLVERSVAEQRPQALVAIEATGSEGDGLFLDVVASPLLGEDGAVVGTSITFTDVSPHVQLQSELERSNRELEVAYEELQSTNEEFATTNEELQSTVEELETTNEELQSTLEEHEATNEELQAANEELQTTNDELRQRTDELDQANGVLKGVLGGIDIGVIVLDSRLHLLSWNERSFDLWGLRQEEVVGRTVHELDIGLPTEQVEQSALACFREGSRIDGGVVDAVSRRGKPVRCRLTALPLASHSGQRGVIVLVEELA
jgi:two-component system CheB/CheR fusion protein